MKSTPAITLIMTGMLGSGLAWTGSTPAQDVPAGTVIDASSIDKLQDQTFEGKRIGDMLVGQQPRMIREFGWAMKLAPNRPVPHAPGIEELTERFKGQAKLDPDKHLVGFTTGVPFPELDAGDPDGGIKLTYNVLRAAWIGHAIDLDPIYFLIIDGEKGLQREQAWHYKRYLMSGRLAEPYVQDANIVKYEGLIAQYPQDIRGIGLLSVNYADGRLPDVYVYVKAFRRVRRLSSSVWADPVQATDFLFDETFGLNLDPTWYEAWNLKEKIWALATVHGTTPYANAKESDPKKKYPFMKFDEAPYWNFQPEAFEPREVWRLEGIPGGNHLVSRRESFVDADPYAPMLVWQDLYDRKGEHWRTLYVGYTPDKWADGRPGLSVSAVTIMDVQRMHATGFARTPTFFINPPNAKAVDYTPEALPRMLD